jgi:hypothetical protein
MFEEWYGPLLIHERLDLLLAQSAFVTARVGGSKDVEMSTFLPDWPAISGHGGADDLVGKLLQFRDEKARPKE